MEIESWLESTSRLVGDGVHTPSASQALSRQRPGRTGTMEVTTETVTPTYLGMGGQGSSQTYLHRYLARSSRRAASIPRPPAGGPSAIPGVIGQDSVEAHRNRLLPICRQVAADRGAGNKRPFPGTTDRLHFRRRRQIPEIDPIGMGRASACRKLSGVVGDGRRVSLARSGDRCGLEPEGPRWCSR